MVRERLASAFRAALGLGPEVEVTSLEYRGVPEWNSVGHMQLVAAIEDEFDLLLETEQIIDMSSFAKALEILSSHGIDAQA